MIDWMDASGGAVNGSMAYSYKVPRMPRFQGDVNKGARRCEGKGGRDGQPWAAQSGVIILIITSVC